MAFKTTLTALSLALSSAAALSAPAPIFDDVQTDFVPFDNLNNTLTDVFLNMTFSQFPAYSVYFGDAIPTGNDTFTPVLGSKFIDTNDPRVLDALDVSQVGMPTSTYRDLLIGQLNPITSLEGNGYNFFWGLFTSYIVNGVLTAQGPVYTGGEVNIWYGEFDDIGSLDAEFDPLSPALDQVYELELTSGGLIDLSGVAVEFRGHADFDYNDDGIDNDATPFAQRFANHDLNENGIPEPGTEDASFYELWEAAQPLFFPTSWRLDTNVDPNSDPIPEQMPGLITTLEGTTAAQIGAAQTQVDLLFEVDGVSYFGPGETYYIRQTDLTGDIDFSLNEINEVPEPGSFSLVTAGLLLTGGLSYRRRRQSQGRSRTV